MHDSPATARSGFARALSARRREFVALVLAAVTLPVDAAELVLGRVSDDPRADYPRLSAMLDYVVPKMADVGITGGRVLMAHDAQQMISYLKRGKVDWITETAGTAVAFEERAQARVLLAAEREETLAYHCVFFARRDRGIRSLADLRGRTIAFQSQASTSAYFLPAAEILQARLPLIVLASTSDRPSPDAVGFVFARTELNLSTWVAKGLVDAGAFSDRNWENPLLLPPEFRDQLEVFHRTGDVPRALELVRADLPPAVSQRLRAVLLAAGDDPAAHEALAAYFDSNRFFALDDGARTRLARLRDGVHRIRDEVE